MRKIEVIFWLTCIASIVMFVLRFLMSQSMLVVSIAFLALFYMYLSFLLLNGIRGRDAFKKGIYAEIGNQKIIASIVVGLVFSLSLFGLLFKLMIWPNFEINHILAVAALVLIGGFSIYKYFQTKGEFYQNILKRLVLILPIAVFALLMPKYAILKWQYQDFPSYVEAFIERNENPNDEELLEKFLEERDKMLEGTQTKPAAEEEE